MADAKEGMWNGRLGHKKGGKEGEKKKGKGKLGP